MATMRPARSRAAASAMGSPATGSEDIDSSDQPRTAIAAARGLGVVAAVGRVPVLGLARLAQIEDRHRRALPVIRQAPHNGVAGPAVRAAGEGVPVPAPAGIRDFGQARRAGGGIGRHGAGDRARPGRARRQREATLTLDCGEIGGANRVHPSQRRSLVGDPRLELVQVGSPALDLAPDTLVVVAGRAGQRQAPGQPVQVGPEPHALNGAGYAQASTSHWSGMVRAVAGTVTFTRCNLQIVELTRLSGISSLPCHSARELTWGKACSLRKDTACDD